MKMNAQKWSRLGRNLTTLIIILSIAMFFYVYNPSRSTGEWQYVEKDDSTESVCSVSKDTIIDPNTATMEDFLRIGMTKKQALSCLHYRQKGGFFRRDEDLIKIYTIEDSDYAILRPYIHVQEARNTKKMPRHKAESNKTAKKHSAQASIERISLNNCDTTALKNLPKIGSFRARKIIERRDALGGFYHVNQLISIYSMDSSITSIIEPYLDIDTSLIQKININKATFKELVRHPLVTYEMAKQIFAYKEIVGTIQSIQELRNNNIISDQKYSELQFYLKTF